MKKRIGILTSGGDTPGLNAAIRAVGKGLDQTGEYELIGFLEGFRGLGENRFIELKGANLSGILTRGGTILGTSRDKPHKMAVAGKEVDMVDTLVENFYKNRLTGLVCLGGGGTQKNALRLLKKGVPVITLPKTIDNDIAFTDTTFGYDTALHIATEAIDRLHSTAHSHHRLIIVETMGHRVGWLALGSGLAGGADVILLPEIPYQEEKVAQAIFNRMEAGKPFSIIAVAEGAISESKIREIEQELGEGARGSKKFQSRVDRYIPRRTAELGETLAALTGKETRITILGHLQRGGTPSAYDRLLATLLGTACVREIERDNWGTMIAIKGETPTPISLEKVAGKKKFVPLEHPMIQSARSIGICLGD